MTISSSPKTRNMNEKRGEQRGPERDEDRAQDERREDAEREHARLVLDGTANVAMMITKTKRLSTDRLFSTM